MATPRDQEVYTYQLTAGTNTFSHPVRDGANRFMLVELMGRFDSVTSVTYNGSAINAVVGSSVGAGAAGTAHRQVAMYYLVAPTVGTASLVVTVSGNNQGTVRVRNMVDVDQSTPLRSQGGGNFAASASGASSTSDTLSVTSVAGDLVLDLIAVSTTGTIGAGQTRAGYGTQPTNQYASTKVATGTSESMAWTYSSGTFGHCAISIVGSTATQPAKADYTGGRGKKTWIVSSTVTTGGEVVAAGATVYMPVAPSAESSTTSSANRTRARVAGTYRTPKIRIVANAATSASTAVLQEDGVDTSVTITIPAGTTGLIAGTGSVAVSGSSSLSWRVTNGGGGSIAMTMTQLEFEPSGSDTITLLSAHSSSALQLTAGATHHLRVTGSRGSAAGIAESEALVKSPIAGVWSGLEIIKVGNTTTGTVDVYSRINGANGNQTLSWAASGSASQEDTTHSDTIADGDNIAWRAVIGAGTGTWENERWSSRIANANGEYLLATGAAPGVGAAALQAGDNFLPLAGEMARSSAESAVQAEAPFNLAAKRLWVEVGENTALLPAYVVLRVNGADTALKLEIQPGIEGAYYADVWNTVNINAGDLVCISASSSAVNNAIRLRSAGIVGIERVAAANTLTVSQGSYAVAGQSVNLRAARRMAVTQGAYAISGQPVGLRGARQLAIAQGAYVLAGQSVTLTKSAAGGLVVTQGAYAIAGQPVDLRAARRLAVSQGAYALAGQSVTLTKTAANALAVTPGSYTLNGRPVDLRAARRMAVSQGAYALAGQSVTLTRSGVGYTLAVTPGAYLLGGQPVSLRAARRLAVTRGTYSLSGMPVTLQYSGIEVYDRAPLPINLPRRPKRRIGSLLKEQ